MRYFILFLLMASASWAGRVEWDFKQVDYSDEYSRKSYANKDFVNINLPSGSTVYASMFMNEKLDMSIFPSTMTGITFLECNLDNIILPPGNLIINLYTYPPKKFKMENDLRYWVLDEQGKAKKLLEEDYWKNKGFSIDPKDIPAEKIKNYEDDIPKAKP